MPARPFENEHIEIIAPGQWTLPAVLSSPHSGSTLPPDLRNCSRLSDTALRRSEDRHVDELFSPCVDLGAPLLRALVSRAYVDLNREPFEFDPRMFIEPLPHHMNTTSPRVLAGLGTIPRVVGEGENIYNRKLSLADAIQRIETFYRPYHRTLSALLGHVHRETGFVCLVDCHSMPASAVAPASHTKSVDIVLGDRYGAACRTDLVEAWRNGFSAAGLNVKLNHPYPGGFITETHGQPRRGRNALQIELNRSLFISEDGTIKDIGFNELKRVIKSAFEVFAALLPVASVSAAAE
jgi:N-formylglutamate amidohydrolase